MSQAEILRLEGVTKQYSNHHPPALNNVSFSLRQGDLLGLLGASGCGKTTLLRLIAGFEQAQAGTILLDGQQVAGQGRWVPPEKRDVGMVFQDYALFPHLTVAKNVAFGMTHHGRKGGRKFTPQQVHDLTQEAIARVGLQGLDHRYPHELSGGQQQRVALARALAPHPTLILLDEPLSNLDVQVRLRLRQEIREVLKATGISAIFVTHDQEEALSISDWVAVMRNGQIEQLDTPETLYYEPTSRFVAEFVTQANFLPAQWNGAGWETEVGSFYTGNYDPLHRELVTTGSASAIASPTMTSVKADLMIRQEDLHLEPDETAPTIVRDRQFLGREHSYSLLTPSGRELHARTTSRQMLSIGDRVKLSVAESALRIFPREASPR